MAAVRGSVWENRSKKAGFGKSIGSYSYLKKGDRQFVLTLIRTAKTRVYESPEAAMRDGWYITTHGK